jgi:hypothetical protein
VFGPDGNLYVSSARTDVVKRYNGTTGVFIDNFASGGGLSYPFALVFGPDGNLYVCSFHTGEVKRYNGTTGAFVDNFVPYNSGGLNGATGLAFGPDANLYVSSFYGYGVKRCNGTTGAFMDNFVPPSSGGLNRPTLLTFTPSALPPHVTCAKVDTTNGCAHTRTITYTAVDGCKNSNTCVQVITWTENTTPPLLTCASNKTVACGTVWNFDPPAATDSCNGTNGTLTILGTVTNGLCPQLITRTWLLINACGLTNTCSQTITVQNTNPPVMTCVPNKQVQFGSGWSFDPPAAVDACSGSSAPVSILSTVTNGANPVLITRTWLATDACGNTNTCSQTVTEILPPVVQTVALTTGGAVQLSFQTVNTLIYVIEYSDALTNPSWTPLTTLVGDGSIATVTEPRPPGQTRFYRVHQIRP